MGRETNGSVKARSLLQAMVLILVGGGFYHRGVARRPTLFARWDGQAWSPVGTGVAGEVRAIAQLPSGDLVVGGTFTSAGGNTASYIARWNGATWSAMGAGMNSYVNALMALPNGDLIAGGSFDFIGSLTAHHVARWNGSSWSAMGTLGSVTSGPTYTLARKFSNGDLFAGGGAAGPMGMGRAWSPLGSSGPNGTIYAANVLANGDLVIAGNFTFPGSAVPLINIARWNGSAWSPVGAGIGTLSTQAIVYALASRAQGELLAGGAFNNSGGYLCTGLGRWTTRPACLADFNCSGQLEVQDIFDFLAAWFNNDPNADFNGGGLSVQDIFDFLTSWFAGC